MEDYRLFCTSFHTSLRLFAVNFAVVYTSDAGFLHLKSIRKRLAAGLRLDPLGSFCGGKMNGRTKGREGRDKRNAKRKGMTGRKGEAVGGREGVGG